MSDAATFGDRTGRPMASEDLDSLEKELLDRFQRDFPLSPRPYAEIAERLGVTESEVLAALAGLEEAGIVSRVGAVVAPHRAGWSTLAAMEVPPDRLESVAELVNGFAEVNHNYQRAHRFNLWFVVTGADRECVAGVLHGIRDQTGLAVLDLPLIKAYHIDLGFKLQWH
jgi:DNA-binding Lrp family transcriptional regulator